MLLYDRLENLGKLHKAINGLLGGQFPTHVKYIVGNCLYLTNRQYEYILSGIENARVNGKDYMRHLRILMASVNPIFNGESHPFGLGLSVFCQSSVSQNLLNVKRLDEVDSSSADDVDELVNSKNTPLSKFLVESDILIGSITPRVNVTILYESTDSTNYFWIRVILDNDDSLLSVLIKLTSANLKPYMIHKATDAVYDLYFEKRIKYNAPFYTLLDTPACVKIVYVSSLVKFKCGETPSVAFSNILKFLYCHITKALDFVIDSHSDMEILRQVFLMSAIFMSHGNLKNTKAHNAPALDCLSNQNARNAIIKKSNVLCEKEGGNITKNYIKQTNAELGNTEHVIHECMSDREFKMINVGSVVGNTCASSETIIKLPL